MLTRKAVNFVNRRAPKAKPFFLWLTYTAPHSGGPDPNPNPPRTAGNTAKPAPRHAHAFDSEPLPRPPNFNEADVSDKPGRDPQPPALERRVRSRTSSAGTAAELESLLSVDEGVEEVVRALRAKGELGNTVLMFTADNGFFHGEHRIPTARRTSTRSRSGCRS